MNDSEILFLSIGILILIAIIIQYFLWKDRMKDKNSLNHYWQKFLESESNNNVRDLKFNGEKLIWNKYLKNEQLEKIIDVVNRVKNYPTLKKLANDAYNKKLHYDRILPQSGSNGGIKQSW
jgi:ATP-dependent Zn protease